MRRFTVGATVNACTKGLWLWGTPVKLADGLTVLFVDTEGLGSTSRTQTEDSQIFSLALLLSSLFVWNSRGVIDGNALEDFALVVNLTKHIHVRSGAADKAISKAEHGGGGAEGKDDTGEDKKKRAIYVASGGSAKGSGGGHELDELSEHFPAFMWVVRDFTLRLEDGGRKINDRQYLENALKPQQSFTSEAASRNQIRTLLSSFFRERDCCTLVRPAEDEATLRNLSNVALADLRPEFQAGLASLKTKVFASIRAKAVNGRALSGGMLATLATTYAEALNSGGVPTISTAWDRVLQSQAAEAMARCLEAYDADAARTLALPDAAWLSSRVGPRPDDDGGGLGVLEALLDASKLPLEANAVRAAHAGWLAKAEADYARAVWADESQQVSSSSVDQQRALDLALEARLERLFEVNAHVSTLLCARAAADACDRFDAVVAAKLGGVKAGGGAAAPGGGGGVVVSYAEVLKERLAAVDAADLPQRRAAYLRDLATKRDWLDAFPDACDRCRSEYYATAAGPSAGGVFADVVAPRLLEAALTWATALGVEHRAVQKLCRAEVAKSDEAKQQAQGKLAASKSAAQRERASLERAADQAELEAKARIDALQALIDARSDELARHKEAAARLEAAYAYGGDLVDQQTAAHRDLGDDVKRGLAAVRDRVARMDAGADGGDADGDVAEGLDAQDLGFEREEMAEFAPLKMADLKERIAEDEKELELMHEHAALTIEHAKVKKMLLADKDHELQEYEYQWGVAKANVAASEGELMVVDEEVSVLRGLVLQMHKHLEATSRSGKFPSDIARSLPRDQKALLEQLLDGR